MQLEAASRSCRPVNMSQNAYRVSCLGRQIPGNPLVTPYCYLHLRVVEQFPVGHRGHQAEPVTFSGLNVHDRRPADPQPFPPDN